MMRAADLVVVVGTSAQVSTPEGVALEVWDTDEPSLRGIDGLDRMRLIRDDITTRIRDLVERSGQ
jgi:arsenate-mycothiol transferase